MIKLSEIISDAQSELEGGKSAKIDWILASRQAMQAMLAMISPETTKRIVPIYGGLTTQLQVYACPDDVKTPSRLFALDKSWFADFVTPQEFYRNPNTNYIFTIEYVNGVRYIVARIPVNFGQMLVDNMDSADGRTGIVLTQTDYNALPFYQYGMEGVFSDVDYASNYDLPNVANIETLGKGVAVLPLYFEDADIVESIKIKLITTTGNYLTLTSVQTLSDGQNYIRIPIKDGVATGSYDPSSITKTTYEVKMKTGKSQNVVFGRFTVQKSVLFNFEYESTCLFVKTDGTWKETPSQMTDNVNINQDVRSIFHFELCKIAERKIKKNKDGNSGFENLLGNEYEQYYKKHPAQVQNVIENVSPDLSTMMYPYDYYSDLEPTPTPVVARTYNYDFIDSYELQDIAGNVIDGVNTNFKLPKTPYPASSVVLNRSGAILAYGVDFIVSGDTLIMTEAPASIYSGLPFQVSYRYQI